MVGVRRAATDTTTTSDALVRLLALLRVPADTTSVSDTVSGSLGLILRFVEDTTAVSDSIVSVRRGPIQFLRPISDIGGDWHGEDARLTTLWTSVDDSPFDDGTYIGSPPAPGSSDYEEFDLPTALDPATPTITSCVTATAATARPRSSWNCGRAPQSSRRGSTPTRPRHRLAVQTLTHRAGRCHHRLRRPACACERGGQLRRRRVDAAARAAPESSGNDGNQYELGARFTVVAAGRIIALDHYLAQARQRHSHVPHLEQRQPSPAGRDHRTTQAASAGTARHWQSRCQSAPVAPTAWRRTDPAGSNLKLLLHQHQPDLVVVQPRVGSPARYSLTVTNFPANDQGGHRSLDVVYQQAVVSMAVARTGGSSTNFAAATTQTQTFAFTLPGGTNYLVALFSIYVNNTVVNSVTWKPDSGNAGADQAMTLIGRYDAGNPGSVEIWGLANPTRHRHRLADLAHPEPRLEADHGRPCPERRGDGRHGGRNQRRQRRSHSRSTSPARSVRSSSTPSSSRTAPPAARQARTRPNAGTPTPPAAPTTSVLAAPKRSASRRRTRCRGRPARPPPCR